MSETDIQRNIFRAAIRDERVAWISRNNVGGYKLKNRWIEYGLGKGSSDLIGQLKDGRFFALEIKTSAGKASKEQMLFINRVNMWGGVAAVVRNVDGLKRLLDEVCGVNVG